MTNATLEHVQGTVFLSHSAIDKPYVEKVFSDLDPALTFYDIKTITPGQSTLDAMKAGVRNASVFVLFHSETSQSVWVDFETNLAEVNHIERPNLKIIVCPINGSTYRTLPNWMKSYMTATEEFTPRDIARSVRVLLNQSLEASISDHPRVYPGREALKREISLDLLRASAAAKPISALVLSGIQGMGRGTLAAELIRDSYPGMRPGGPIFEIPESGDAIDWHLNLLSDLRSGLSDAEMGKQIEAFCKLSARQQADTLLASLAHWGSLNQVVTIRHRWGLRDRGNKLKPWLAELLRLLTQKHAIRLVFISERQLPQAEIRALGNIAQYNLEELDHNAIQSILINRIHARYLNAQRLPELADKIDGHPATANYVAYLVGSGRSMDSLVASPSEIHSFQDSILVALYESNTLTSLQKSILHLLSWFPRLSSSIIADVFSEFERDVLTQELWELVDYSLVNQAEMGRYKCPAVVSSTYRRRNEGGYDDIVNRVASILTNQFDNDTLDFELIDSLVVAVVSLNMDISPRLRALLTPSRLLPAIENEHSAGLRAAGDQARKHFERCKSLSELAASFKMPDDDLENILFYGGDSSVRLGIYPKEMVGQMRTKGMLTADYVEGSFLYHRQRDFDGAANVLSRTLSSSRFRVRNVRLLTRIYLRDRKFPQALDALGKIPESRLMRDTGLVIMKVKALRGTRNRAEAQTLLDSLKGRSDNYGDIALYRAGALLREGNYAEALRHVDQARQAPKANQAVLSILKCACEIESGDLTNLGTTCATARSIGRDSDALQLQARAALAGSDWVSALDYIDQVAKKDWFDLNVELRAVQSGLESSDIKYDPVQTETLKKRKEEVLRAINDAVEGNNLMYS